jgi:circadian clock protein KaiB
MNDDPSWNDPGRPPSWAGTAESPAKGVERYVLRLYVCGMTTRSQSAIQALRRVCERHLANSYEFEVINLSEHPELAQREQIIASPTLVKERPLPQSRMIGDMSREERVIAGLGIRPLPADPDPESGPACP